MKKLFLTFFLFFFYFSGSVAYSQNLICEHTSFLCPGVDSKEIINKDGMYYTEFNSLYDNAVLIESTHAYLKDKCDQVHSVSDNMDYDPNKTLTKTFPILSEVGRFFDQYNFDDRCNDGHHGKSYHVAFAEDMAKIIL